MSKKHEKDAKQVEKEHGTKDSSGHGEESQENPPRTTSGGWFTTPKFGSSTSGGGEIEPGPERD